MSLLRANGCSVWWDRDIAPGRAFEQKIEEALASTECVVIAITQHAAKSDWVRAETAVGQQHDKLIPVLLDDVPLPLALRALQVADLRAWPNGAEVEVEKLLSAISTHSAQSTNTFIGRGDAMRTLKTGLDAALGGEGGARPHVRRTRHWQNPLRRGIRARCRGSRGSGHVGPLLRTTRRAAVLAVGADSARVRRCQFRRRVAHVAR